MGAELRNLLDGMRARLQPLLDEETRARELAGSVPEGELYFGLIGVECSGSTELLDGACIFRPVVNPPGVVHIARAADLAHSDYLAVSRYSREIRAEIVMGVSEGLGFGLSANLAWHLAALLKLRAAPMLACPACATVSWDTISAVSDGSVVFGMLDDVPRRISVGGTSVTFIDADSVSWVEQHAVDALHLRGVDVSRRFGLAFNLGYSWNHTDDLRIALAGVWAGLEALFGERSDRRVTQALASRISSWLPSVAPDDVRRLYDRRCDAVHGRRIEEADMLDDLRASADLLRDALVGAIERAAVPLPDWSPRTT